MIDLKGKHIFYRDNNYIDDIEFVALVDNGDLSVKCVSAKPLKDKMSFNDYGNNDWNTSSLKKYLNEEYIKRFDKKCLHETDDGQIFLLSKEEAKIYKNILPKYSAYWWTRSPNVDTAVDAWYVTPYGGFDNCNVVLAGCIIPSCIFDIHNMKFSIEEGNVILTSKN